MPLSGDDATARSIAHMRYAERYARHKKVPKSIAHFGRAMHYGTEPPVYNIRIEIKTGLLDYFIRGLEEGQTYQGVILNATNIRSTVQFALSFSTNPSAIVHISLTDINRKILAIPSNERALLEKHIREAILKRGEWEIPDEAIAFEYPGLKG